MNISVILIAFNGDQWLPACLESLPDASVERLHLVLVDNAGNSVIDQLDLTAFDAEILDTPYPMGFAEANNFALVRAGHLEETVLFLNQDTISMPGWVDICLKSLATDEKLGALSPLIMTYDGSDWDPSFLDCIGSENVLQERLWEDDSGHFLTKNAPAPALMVRTNVLMHTGPFDPIFGSYYEDFDLCRRIRRDGYSIGFAREARIAHFSGSTTNTREKELRRMRTIIRNRMIHRLRGKDEPRLQQLISHLFIDTPRRLVRGILGTESSQPPHITLQANLDLLRIAPRLLSQSRDESAWRAYLDQIRWNQRMKEIELETGNSHADPQ